MNRNLPVLGIGVGFASLFSPICSATAIPDRPPMGARDASIRETTTFRVYS
jgi:hypothetical protein